MSKDNSLRIGILTIHAAINYGSMLQAYALQKQLEELASGDTVELIDYLPPCIMDGYSLNPGKHLKDPGDFLKYCVNFDARRKQRGVFEDFARNCFHRSSRQYTDSAQLEADAEKWDVCVLGSDQVWNPEIVADDRAFWLDFAKSSYKASFSSSFGTTEIREDYRKKLAQTLIKFDQIAVREPSAAAMLSDVEKPIAVTCDPVFLLSADQWAELERKPEYVPEHYIQMYTVERNEKLEELVKQLSAHYGIPVVDLGLRSNPMGYFGIHSPEFGPREFLYLIHHADFLVTNSFHGTAFGTIFRKKCVSILHHSRGTRIRELAELSSRTRFVLSEDASPEDVIMLMEEPYEDDYGPLNERIAGSKAYLEEMLTEARYVKFGENEGNAAKKQ